MITTGYIASMSGRNLLVGICAVLFLTIATFFPEPAISAEGVRVAYVNAVSVLDRAPQAANASRNLQREFEPREEELLELREHIRERESELEKNSLVWTASEVQMRRKEITGLQRRLKRLKEELREDVNLRHNEELAKLQRLIREVIIEIAKEEGYDLVVQQAVYVDRSINLTEQVLERLNSR